MVKRNKKHAGVKKFLLLGILAGVLGILYYSSISTQPREKTLSDTLFGWKFPIAKFPLTGSEQKLIAYSDIRDPGGIPQGLPVRLKIPSIGVDTAIEDAFITSDGRMDVPAGSVHVAWFALGPHPGQKGSAVIGGHFGIDHGVPKVFYNLNKLKIGEKVYVEDDSGNTLAFVVRSTTSFDRNADSTTVFTSKDGLAHLNIVTCEGVWNQVNDSYPQRLVVFTDAIPNEGAVVVKKQPQVVAKLPPTAVTAPTPAPTIAASPIATPEKRTVTTSTGKTAVFFQSAAQFINIFYATTADGVITSTLLASILLISIKILRRFHG